MPPVGDVDNPIEMLCWSKTLSATKPPRTICIRDIWQKTLHWHLHSTRIREPIYVGDNKNGHRSLPKQQCQLDLHVIGPIIIMATSDLREGPHQMQISRFHEFRALGWCGHFSSNKCYSATTALSGAHHVLLPLENRACSSLSRNHDV